MTMEIFELVIDLNLNFLTTNDPHYGVYGVGVYNRNGNTCALSYGTFLGSFESDIQNTLELYVKNTVTQAGTTTLKPIHYTIEYI